MQTKNCQASREDSSELGSSDAGWRKLATVNGNPIAWNAERLEENLLKTVGITSETSSLKTGSDARTSESVSHDDES